MKIELPEKITLTETQLTNGKAIIPLADILDVEVKNQNLGFRTFWGCLIGLLLFLSFSIITSDSGMLFKVISLGVFGFFALILIVQFGVGRASLYVLTKEHKIEIATAFTPDILEIVEGLNGMLKKTRTEQVGAGQPHLRRRKPENHQ